MRRASPSSLTRSWLLNGFVARRNGVRIGRDLVGPLAGLEPVLATLSEPAVRSLAAIQLLKKFKVSNHRLMIRFPLSECRYSPLKSLPSQRDTVPVLRRN